MPAQIGLARKALAVLAGSMVLLAACAAPNKLLVLEWSGYDDPLYWTDFKTANATAPVTFEIGSSDADILGKMEAGSQADIFHFYTGWQQFYVDQGLVKEIDTTKLTNWDKVPDSFKKMGQINGKQYYVPWDWGFTSILYNTDHVASVDSWDVLFDDQYTGHIAMWDDGPAAVTVSSYIHGWDETKVTAEQLAQAEQEWKDQKPLNLKYWVDEYADLCPDVEGGDIWIAYAWQGCYAQTLYNESQPVAYATPVEGRNSWVGLYGISSKTANYDLALKFLDMKLADETCRNAVENFYYGCVNSEVMAAIDDEVLIKAFSIDDPSILETTNFTPLVTDAQREAWTEMWANVKAN